jgi:hypothetical protein
LQAMAGKRIGQRLAGKFGGRRVGWTRGRLGLVVAHKICLPRDPKVVFAGCQGRSAIVKPRYLICWVSKIIEVARNS